MTSYIIRGIPKYCSYAVKEVNSSLNLDYFCTLSILEIVKSNEKGELLFLKNLKVGSCPSDDNFVQICFCPFLCSI